MSGDGRPKVLVPCPTCPWRASTPEDGFPGGKINVPALLRAVDPVVPGRAMQCHTGPASPPRPCAGFQVQVGRRSASYRRAAALGFADPLDAGAVSPVPLISVRQLIERHGTMTSEPCKTRCKGCGDDCPNIDRSPLPTAPAR